MLESKASKIVKETMEEGNNCCEAVLLACNEVWDLGLAEDTLAATGFFGRGMGSGCTCGALAGIIMAAGILHQRHSRMLDDRFPARLHARFVNEFGSACCRVIRKERPLWRKRHKQACIDLTSWAVTMLIEEWEDASNAEITAHRDHPNI